MSISNLMGFMVFLAVLGTIGSTFFLVYKFVKKQPRKPAVITLSSCVVAIVIFAILMTITMTPEEKAALVDRQAQKQAIEIAEKAAKESAEKEISPQEVNVEKSEDKSISKEKPDFDLITRSGHPVLYDSIKSAHSFWGNDHEGKIKFSDDGLKYDNATLLVINTYRKDKLIDDIEIYFSNSQNITGVDLSKAKEIAISYIPMEYYTLKQSYSLIPKDNQSEFYYVIECSLNSDKKREAMELNYLEYLNLIISTDSAGLSKNIIIRSGFSLPKWMNFPEKNGYKKEKWNS